MDFKIETGTIDSYDGQVDMVKKAISNDTILGYLQYSVYEGKPYIQMIEVYPKYKHQGIGTALLKALQKDFPKTPINTGYTTEEGTPFINKVTKQVNNPVYTRYKNELAKLREQEKEIDKKWEAFYASNMTSMDEIEVDELNELDRKINDRIWDLEQKLEYTKSSFTYVKDKDIEVYHGMDKHDEFINNREDILTWFTPDKDYAKTYGDQVYKGIINDDNFLYVGDVEEEIWDGQEYSQAFKDFCKRIDMTPDQLNKYLSLFGFNLKIETMIWEITSEYPFAKLLKEMGYEGVITDEHGTKGYGVFNAKKYEKLIKDYSPQQIKEFQEKFGNDNYYFFNKYGDRLKNLNISSDIQWHLKNTSKEDMDNIIKSIRGKLEVSTGNNAILIAQNEYYKLYDIKDWQTAVKLGENTSWCIAGRVDNKGDNVDLKGAENWFNKYINENHMKMYIYGIPSRGYEKICIEVFEDSKTLDDCAIVNANDVTRYDQDCINYFKQYLPRVEYNGLLINSVDKNHPYIINDGELVHTYKDIDVAIIPSDVETIVGYAMEHCTKLTKIIIPATVKRIYNDAFVFCENLKEIKVANNIRLEESMFENCNNTFTINGLSQEKYFNNSIKDSTYDGITVTDNPYEVKKLLERGDKPYRILYDFNKDLYMMCHQDDYVHSDMLEKVWKQGYYPEFTHEFEVGEYFDFRGNLNSEEDYPDDKLLCIVSCPADLLDKFISRLREDDYEYKYDYDFGVIMSRDRDFNECPLYKVLGKPKSASEIDYNNVDENNQYGIKSKVIDARFFKGNHSYEDIHKYLDEHYSWSSEPNNYIGSQIIDRDGKFLITKDYHGNILKNMIDQGNLEIDKESLYPEYNYPNTDLFQEIGFVRCNNGDTNFSYRYIALPTSITSGQVEAIQKWIDKYFLGKGYTVIETSGNSTYVRYMFEYDDQHTADDYMKMIKRYANSGIVKDSKKIKDEKLSSGVIVTDNEFEVRDIILSSTASRRILYDFNEGLFMIGYADCYIHRQLLESAFKDGGYYGDYAIDIDEEGLTNWAQKYCENHVDDWLVYMISVPKDKFEQEFRSYYDGWYDYQYEFETFYLLIRKVPLSDSGLQDVLRNPVSTKRIEDSAVYEPPYNAKQILENYGEDLYNKLCKDPAHNWRIKTGIELIHREPTVEELKKIWKNWQLMSSEQKKISDKKSIELFGIDNKTHYKQLLPQYEHPVEDSSKKIYYMPQAIKDKYKDRYDIEILSINKLMEDNDLSDVETYHTSTWGNDRTKYHFNPIKADGDSIFIKIIGNNYHIADGRHRVQALYNDGYDSVECLVKNAVKDNRIFVKEYGQTMSLKRWKEAHDSADNIFNTTDTGMSHYNDLLPHSPEKDYMAKAKNLKGEIIMMSPKEYYDACATKVFGNATTDNLIDQRSRDNGSDYLEKLEKVITKSHQKFPITVLDLADKTQEGLHRMMVAGELFGWDHKFPVLVVTFCDEEREKRHRQKEYETKVENALEDIIKETKIHKYDNYEDLESEALLIAQNKFNDEKVEVNIKNNQLIITYDNMSKSKSLNEFDVKDRYSVLSNEEMSELLKEELDDADPQELVKESESEDPERTVKSKEITITYKGLNNRGDLLFKTFTPSSGKTWDQTIRLHWLKDYEKEYKDEPVSDEELIEAITSDDVEVYCDDPSFKYMGWKAKAIKEHYGIVSESKTYRNHDGTVCKHLLAILKAIPQLKNKIMEDLRKQFFRSTGAGEKTAKVENNEEVKKEEE